MLALLLIAAGSDVCQTAVPIETTVAEIKASPERFVGRCVYLTAWSNGESVFTSRSELRRQNAARRQLTAAEVGRRMGVYLLPALSDGLADRQSDHGLRWSLTGEVDTCANLIALAEQRIAQEPVEEGVIRMVFAPGYCHYWEGPVLLVASGTLTQ